MTSITPLWIERHLPYIFIALFGVAYIGAWGMYTTPLWLTGLGSVVAAVMYVVFWFSKHLVDCAHGPVDMRESGYFDAFEKYVDDCLSLCFIMVMAGLAPIALADAKAYPSPWFSCAWVAVTAGVVASVARTLNILVKILGRTQQT